MLAARPVLFRIASRRGGDVLFPPANGGELRRGRRRGPCRMRRAGQDRPAGRSRRVRRKPFAAKRGPLCCEFGRRAFRAEVGGISCISQGSKSPSKRRGGRNRGKDADSSACAHGVCYANTSGAIMRAGTAALSALKSIPKSVVRMTAMPAEKLAAQIGPPTNSSQLRRKRLNRPHSRSRSLFRAAQFGSTLSIIFQNGANDCDKSVNMFVEHDVVDNLYRQLKKPPIKVRVSYVPARTPSGCQGLGRHFREGLSAKAFKLGRSDRNQTAPSVHIPSLKKLGSFLCRTALSSNHSRQNEGVVQLIVHDA